MRHIYYIILSLVLSAVFAPPHLGFGHNCCK